ncbi:hypothetical protein DL768_011032 [Monosporascus sp. mg162]|nr:hypothetical protein DL768_011032 [Monosporascus sp. mg162]
MALLLDQRGAEVKITEDVVKAAAGNGNNGKEMMALLLDQRGAEVKVTEEVVKAAAGNWSSGEKVMALLLDQRGTEVKITEEVAKAAAGTGRLATRQDIYNRIAEVRRDACEGQSPIHALANQLEKEGFWSRIQFAPDGHVTAVLLAHPDSLAYLRAYLEVLLLDFINAASILFPPPTTATLICIWHANKAVLARCQPAFPEAEKWKDYYGFWHSIINSPIEEAYAKSLAEFQEKYVSEYLEVGYIKNTWLIPFEEKLVRTWVDRSPHFGNTATSRVEGIHALLKSYPKRPTFDLFEAWKAIQLALLNQLSELKSNLAKQQIRTSLELSGALYGVVRGWVSHEALRKSKNNGSYSGGIHLRPRLMHVKARLFSSSIFTRIGIYDVTGLRNYSSSLANVLSQFEPKLSPKVQYEA